MTLQEVGDDYTKDGTVDLRGNPVRRSQRGRWKACSFVIVYEIFERMAYYGISSNLVIFMTTKLHQGTVQSSNNVTNWVGTSWLTPILGAYVADAHLGRYITFVISSTIYFSGMALLTLSVSLPDLRPPKCTKTNVEDCEKASVLQLAVYFGALYILAIGTPFYRHKLPTGSPFTKMARVIVASLRKAQAPMSRDPTCFHELPLLEYESKRTFPVHPTRSLRFLDRASLKTGPTNKWSLCTTTEVEETKQMLRMLPVLFITFVPSMMLAQVITLFVKQGTLLNRHITSNFSIPPASLVGFTTFSMLVTIVIYDQIFVKLARKLTGNPRGITLLQRMGIGIFLHILIMIIASVTERYRLKVAADHGLVHQTAVPLPLTIFVLLPQFVLMGLADTFLEVAKLEFFYDQAPESMKSLGTSYMTTSLAAGNFMSSLLLSTVARVTKNQGRGWILNNLNESRLDDYYMLFAVINLVNFIFFLMVSKFYVYRAEITDSANEKQETKVLDNNKE
ncbi:hypothetical protein Bca101_050872 [Brassica carinata]